MIHVFCQRFFSPLLKSFDSDGNQNFNRTLCDEQILLT
ncbi:hypothetical protein NBRC3293_1365 [Gluconobacter oxydans NBRC 3293]|uniref:Uncharacterized protein n=1 Tax=Gluconobacter oxydans NBRC 3293 TaxID=1315969 RepID=A0A829WJ67_GLUOY|nr:hypothetical protein NBRC3293_1365 [Gluconobacter oxydans NBRC 3293]